MKTVHRFVIGNAGDCSFLENESCDLIVTSPPYPMVGMWDEQFAESDPQIAGALADGEGPAAWELMHSQLDRAWSECTRVLRPGGLLCINIGDATRSVERSFRLYPNHTRVMSACMQLGLNPLPMIHWYKPTNAPNKFMGSGMLAPGAYVTLEHEYILILRNGEKRGFPGQLRVERRESAYFWEERNSWFSDRWTIGSARQRVGREGLRSRSAAFPLELPFRLISMYSVRGDTVLDPFSGTGTTARAAATLARNSISVDLEQQFHVLAQEELMEFVPQAAEMQTRRLESHRRFAAQREQDQKPLRHFNERLGVPVTTGQEADLDLLVAQACKRLNEGQIQYEYQKIRATDDQR